MLRHKEVKNELHTAELQFQLSEIRSQKEAVYVVVDTSNINTAANRVFSVADTVTRIK